jgi:pimeloyl-ACP methyl ester carboxylesterase
VVVASGAPAAAGRSSPSRVRSRRVQRGVDRVQPRWVEVGDLRFPVLEAGVAGAPPAVLVPGLTDGLMPVTQPRVRELLRDAPLPMDRFHCLMISHRHPAQAPLTTQQLAQDLAALLDRLVDRPAWLFAHSMGAMVAQHLAVQRPDLVAGLSLSATLARADDRFRQVLARWETLVVARRWRDFALDALTSSYTGSELLRRRIALRVSHVPSYDDDLVERHRALTTACASHDASADLGAIRCPTLVLAGGRDEVCPPHHAEELAAAIPGARLEVFGGLGHGFPEQAPRRFVRTVLRFIEGQEP